MSLEAGFNLPPGVSPSDPRAPWNQPDPVECPRCSGSGKDARDCERCMGDGVLYDQSGTPLEKCPECEDCPQCEGEGTVDPREIEDDDGPDPDAARDREYEDAVNGPEEA